MFHQREIPAAKGGSDQIEAQGVLGIAVGIFLILHGKIGIRKCAVVNGGVAFLRDLLRQSGASAFVGKRRVAKRDDGGDAVILMTFQEACIHRLDIILRLCIEFGGIRVGVIAGILADVPDNQPYGSD